MSLDDFLVLRERMRSGTNDIQVLRAMISSDDNCVWEYAATKLGALGLQAKDAVNDLLHFIRDDESHCTHGRHDDAVMEAIRAVVKIAPNDPKVLSTLRALASGNPAVQNHMLYFTRMKSILIQIRRTAELELENLGETEGESWPIAEWLSEAETNF
jgi:hypothetical protein